MIWLQLVLRVSSSTQDGSCGERWRSVSGKARDRLVRLWLGARRIDEWFGNDGFLGSTNLSPLHYEAKVDVSGMDVREHGCREWRIRRIGIGAREGAFLGLRSALAAFGKPRGRTFCFFVRQPLQAPLIRDGILSTQGGMLVSRVLGCWVSRLAGTFSEDHSQVGLTSMLRCSLRGSGDSQLRSRVGGGAE